MKFKLMLSWKTCFESECKKYEALGFTIKESERSKFYSIEGTPTITIRNLEELTNFIEENEKVVISGDTIKVFNN